MNLKGRHFLTLLDYSPEEIRYLLDLSKDLKDNLVPLPKHFDVEIQYRNHNVAYSSSFYPGCKLLGSDKVIFSSNNYYADFNNLIIVIIICRLFAPRRIRTHIFRAYEAGEFPYSTQR